MGRAYLSDWLYTLQVTFLVGLDVVGEMRTLFTGEVLIFFSLDFVYNWR